MGVLNIEDKKHIKRLEDELVATYSIIQLQKNQIDNLNDKINHLEKILEYKALKLDFNKD